MIIIFVRTQSVGSGSGTTNIGPAPGTYSPYIVWKDNQSSTQQPARRIVFRCVSVVVGRKGRMSVPTTTLLAGFFWGGRTGSFARFVPSFPSTITATLIMSLFMAYIFRIHRWRGIFFFIISFFVSLFSFSLSSYCISIYLFCISRN